ncbi:MAG: hypothetical protein ACJ8ER_03915 [Allosphingosinicella sp.]
MSFMRFAFVAVASLLLSSCILSPGKFVSTLNIGKDRSFTFTYVGEVILLDPAAAMQQGMQEGLAAAAADTVDSEGNSVAPAEPAQPAESPADKAAAKARQDAEARAVAEALSKEVGYRSVEYLGDNRFKVDYSMSGKLDRSFIFPINLDAKSIIPWLAIEVRTDGTARVKAIAFGDPDEGMGSAAKPDSPDRERNGTFTFTTDATLVMQNNEDGMAPGPGTRVVWKVTPTSKSVPTAVVKF